MHCLRDAPENFLIISHGGPIIWFHMFGEIKALRTSRSCILESVIIGPRGIHRNYEINLAQRSYSWI
jgi:hypothetical protein